MSGSMRSRSERLEQRSLFEPSVIAHAELRMAIERLDFSVASRKLEEFQRLWPESELTWEPELVRTGLRLAGRRLDLDSGYEVWKKLESKLALLGVSRSQAGSMRRHFFSRLLAANRSLFEELRTPDRRLLGDFYLLADQPNNARRRYEKEIRQADDGWEVRLRLGNCDFRLGHLRVARSNYHWSHVMGLPEESWDGIEDSEFLTRLRKAEDSVWAFPEACACGVIPPVRFSTTTEFAQFKLQFAEALIESSGPRRFCLYWIISENKPFCTADELLHARLQMKMLHAEFHSHYMQRLE
jgi:hypothetical protein